MGRTLVASGAVDLLPKDLERTLVSAARIPQAQARDHFADVLIVDGKEYPVDITRIKGPLKKALEQMESALRPIPVKR